MSGQSSFTAFWPIHHHTVSHGHYILSLAISDVLLQSLRIITSYEPRFVAIITLRTSIIHMYYFRTCSSHSGKYFNVHLLSRPALPLSGLVGAGHFYCRFLARVQSVQPGFRFRQRHARAPWYREGFQRFRLQS